MWGTILQINSVILAIASLYIIYSFGIAITSWSWKQFAITFVIWLFFFLAEVALAGLAEP